jgi:hypothetical protein
MNNGTRTVALSGDDTTNIGGVVLADQADGDVTELSIPNEIATVKTGKNGNSIYSFNATGLQCDVKVRVVRGSDDDKYLNGIVQDWKNDPAGFVLLEGEFVKRIGDGRGNITYDTYVMNGGVPTRQVPATENVEGGTDQSVAVYEFKFTNVDRAQQ